VVHAGLDILRSELKTDMLLRIPGVRNVVDLIEDICQSSDVAIEILDDLLSYEHIDSGHL
jgi:hypothetical protein